MKVCAPLLKDSLKSPMFDKNGKVNNICNYMTMLITKGIHGNIKKEAVVNTLQELTVSNNIE